MASDDGNKMKRIYTTERTGRKDESARYDVVEEVHNLTIEDSINMLPRLPKKFCRASAILFHNVCPTQTRDIEHDIDWGYIEGEMRETALRQSLKTLQRKLLYRAINMDNRLSDADNFVIGNNNVPETGRLLSTGTASSYAKESVASAYIEDVMARITKFGTNSLYYNNSEWTPRHCRSVLNGVLSHLSPSVNSDIGECPGINSALFYIGCPDSYEAMHVEDGLADSINVLHAGHPKLWFVVESTHYAKLNASLSKTLCKVEGYPNQCCPLPVCHKDLFVSPRFLDENDIRYALIVQKPGDMIYVRKCVPHQVINIGRNIAEALNYGSHEWNMCNDNDTMKMCSCGRNAIKPLVSNWRAQWSIKDPIKINVFHCAACDESFGTATAFESHNLSAHNAKYVCPLCAVKFTTRSSVSRHLKNRHAVAFRTVSRKVVIPDNIDDEGSGGSKSTGGGRSAFNMERRIRKRCDICGKAYVDLTAHARKMHGRLSECDICQRAFTLWELKAHLLESCKPQFGCDTCGKMFSSKRSVSQHIWQSSCTPAT